MASCTRVLQQRYDACRGVPDTLQGDIPSFNSQSAAPDHSHTIKSVIALVVHIEQDPLQESTGSQSLETKLGPYSTRVLAGGLLNPMDGTLHSVGACVGADATSIVVDALED